MKKLIACSVALLAMGALFAQGSKEAAPSAATAGKMELKGNLTMATNTSDPTLSAVQHVVDEFMKANPGVTVEYTTYGKDYENLMKAKMAANDLPDVFATHGWGVKRYSEYLMDLSGCSFASRLSNTIKGVVTTKDGRLVTIPYTIDKKGIIVNTGVLKKLGIDKPPRTWDEFYGDCEKAKQAGITGVYIAGKDNRSQAELFDSSAQTFLVTMKGEGEENQKALLDGTFDWSKWGRVAGFLDTLNKKGYLNKDANTADPVYKAEKLANGETLFMFGNWSLIQEAVGLNKDAALTMMPVPVYDTNDTPVWTGGEREAYGVWKDSPNKDLAIALLEFMAKPENVTYIAEHSGMATGFGDVTPNIPMVKVFEEPEYKELRTQPIFDREWLPSGMWATMRSSGAGVTSGELTVEQACQEMEKSYKKLLSQKK